MCSPPLRSRATREPKARAETRDRCGDGLAQVKPSDLLFVLCLPSHHSVMPAKAGIHGVSSRLPGPSWVPAFAGMTSR